LLRQVTTPVNVLPLARFVREKYPNADDPANPDTAARRNENDRSSQNSIPPDEETL
jgi:hypothetical protein